MHSTRHFQIADVLRRSKAQCHGWVSVLTGSHKAKNEVAMRRACVSSLPNCKSPTKALSKQESDENALLLRKVECSCWTPLHVASTFFLHLLLTPSLLQGFGLRRHPSSICSPNRSETAHTTLPFYTAFLTQACHLHFALSQLSCQISTAVVRE